MKSHNRITTRRILLVAACVLVFLLIVLLAAAWQLRDDPIMPTDGSPPGETTDTGQTATGGENQDSSQGQNSGQSQNSGQTQNPNLPEADPPPEGDGSSGKATSEDIVCKEFARFSGQYVEDGRDEPVENVAAILVTNTSDSFLDLATLTYTIDGKTATFVVTGLPAGRSAWVMENSRMTIGADASFTFVDCVSAFRDNAVTSTRNLTIRSNGNMLTAINNTGTTLKNVAVYYKVVHTDGNYFGGITYMASFDTLAPGEALETLAGHYQDGSTEIVRISWQTG
ncbi:MAG: hypothetical protein IJ422_06250 [Oscillospiraceae bacterium]|nr:hypothetical protein [Oscillospiraceae bacterium]